MTTTHTEVRQYLVDELRQDLVGPGEPDEELRDRPTVHYLTGILYPRDTEIDREQDDDASEAPEEDDEVDAGTLMAMSTNPSSIGMTFLVALGEPLVIECRAAIYVEVPDAPNPLLPGAVRDMAAQAAFAAVEASDTEAAGRPARKPRSLWQRRQLDLPLVPLDPTPAVSDTKELAPGLALYYRVRQRDSHQVVTVALMNTNRVPRESPDHDMLCFFQPEILVASTTSGREIFVARPQHMLDFRDEDRDRNNLLYRHAAEYAVGHGCATNWTAQPDSNASLICTAIIPEFQIRQLSPDVLPGLRAAGMKFLAEAGATDLTAELSQLVEAYQGWIQAQSGQTAGLSAEQAVTAAQHLKDCTNTADRMARGVALLQSDASVRRAFQLANRAMLIQRSRVEWNKLPSADRPTAPVETDAQRWRPFQLAFFLVCLPSIADPTDPARDDLNLLWFPTGGGKTEAYLGLTAFTIFLRRLRATDKHQAAGVTVLMRYTLRLLTLQQFQRAASLIMACEYLRKASPQDLGGDADPITLGLWVGGDATPNSLKVAGQSLRKLLDGERVYVGNPRQLVACPWCGQELTPRDYHVTVKMTIKCPNPACAFHTGLPLYLVDEDIYNIRPTLVIGTVDKFARLPWLAEAGTLFGRPDRRNLPPELIVQDELHLISGPLGTMVGLYEVGVDFLSQSAGRPPKIIASTATIRRAREQALGLFSRSLQQFPPPGLDARDSFFAVEVPPDQKPGRLYVGVYAPGKSMKTALLRVYALLLQKINAHRSSPALRDPYWTLVGYFNSLRELGGAVRLVDDDVRERMRLLARRAGEDLREIRAAQELNSRIYQDEIPEMLKLMEISIEQGPEAMDVLLATNMISVGVDIDRLGLMVVHGQPKLSAEYIQATSRIGRKHPGLVITVYNWTRPRDRSHYERFISYHSAIYSHVEPTSVTPFAGRARDRALHAVLIAMLRQYSETLNLETAASAFDPESVTVETILEYFHNRVRTIDPEELDAADQELRQVIARWVALRRDTLTYGKLGFPHLLESADTYEVGSAAFPTPNSLRGVEGESGLYFVGRRH